MNADWLGVLLGAGSGLLTLMVISWDDIAFEDRLAVWLSRTLTGLLLAHLALPMPTWAGGMTVGLLLSAPSAIHLRRARRGLPVLISGALLGAMMAMLLEWLPLLRLWR